MSDKHRYSTATSDEARAESAQMIEIVQGHLT
jgi:hypothetical protein